MCVNIGIIQSHVATFFSPEILKHFLNFNFHSHYYTEDNFNFDIPTPMSPSSGVYWKELLPLRVITGEVRGVTNRSDTSGYGVWAPPVYMVGFFMTYWKCIPFI